MAGVAPGQYAQLPAGEGEIVKSSMMTATAEIRRGFVQKVYGIVAAQLVLTMAIARPISMLGNKFLVEYPWVPVASFAVLLSTLCVMMCCRETMRTFPKNYMFLGVFTAAESVFIGLACGQYNAHVILGALAITAAMFLMLTAYAFTTKTDMTSFGPYLFMALSAVCCVGFAVAVMQMMGLYVPLLQTFYCLCGVILFSFYVIYDTQLMLGSYGGHALEFSIDDYVFAAINLYVDILNLFVNILQLLGDRN
mmetsp:Transcript_36315/g.67550  ORF Transcript_36315/g.67550 Transcript_36315/m.67550 type:complete len:251 (-) Transcript_36315:183-935(-)